MKQVSPKATFAPPHPRRRVSAIPTWRSTVVPSTVVPSTVVPRGTKQGRRSRETVDRLLLIQVGWVGMALVIVACIPMWKADFDKRTQSQSQTAGTKSVALKQATDRPSDRTVTDTRTDAIVLQKTLFIGGSESLVARTVGHAEGTRTPDGRKTRAYYGHKDPGNGAWNLGSFSFQHCQEAVYNCSTPEEADDRQLRRLQSQDAILQRRATAASLKMTLQEELNGIDLANQAPLAALSDLGYVDRLVQAKQKGLHGQDAILEARVWSYWHPQKNRWDAAGLGNTETGIRHDQERRLLAIARAITVAQQLAAQPTDQRSLSLLKLQPDALNPYSFSQERSAYLWWDAGYWDAKLHHPRQVPPGYETAYDRGFADGLNP